MSLTVDASVFVATFILHDAHHVASTEFPNRVEDDEIAVFCPSIVLPECACSVARRIGDTQLAMDAVEAIGNLPTLQIIVTDNTRAIVSAQVGASARLRGADSLYVQVAVEFGSTLITWDSEMLARSPSSLTAMTPADWLAANPV